MKEGRTDGNKKKEIPVTVDLSFLRQSGNVGTARHVYQM